MPFQTSPRGLAQAAKLRERVNTLSRLGAIDWAEFFPNSSRVTPPPEVPTFKIVAEGYLRRKKRRVKLSTYIGYEKHIKFWMRIFGPMLITHIKRSHILDTLDAVGWQSAKTMSNALTPLKGVFTEAILDDWIHKNPVMEIELPKSQKPLPNPLTATEMHQVLKSLELDPWENYFTFAFATGMRTSELSGLRWADLDLKAGLCTITNARTNGQDTESTKTHRSRTIQLNTMAQRAIRRQRVSVIGQEHVFLNPNTNKAIRSDQDSRRRWKALLADCGLKHRRCYETRHTHATIRLAAGEDLLRVSQDLGHAKPSMTQDNYQGFLSKECPELAKIAFAA